MDLPDEVVRDLDAIRLPVWGRVRKVDHAVPWRFEDDIGVAVEPVQRYLRELAAQGKRPGTLRSYAYDLRRWWQFLRVIGVEWDKATSAETRDFVLWFSLAEKRTAGRRKASAATAGTVNAITRKQYQDDNFKPATVRHSNTVLRAFYEFWIEQGVGPLVNPMPRDKGRGGGRPNAHHNPLTSFRAEGRLRYNPPMPKRRPRAMPDALWDDLFAAMSSDRDRAIVALDVSTGARAEELLGMVGADVDWGEQLIRVTRKGTRAQQWLPASPDAFVWLRLYFVEGGEPGPNDPVWRTLRRRSRDGGDLERRRLTYDAWRAVLKRANARLGTNWTMHDLRHTCAIRMVRDRNLSLRDVQVLLGHAHLSTTQIYFEEDEDQMIIRVREHHLEREERAKQPPPPVAAGYDVDDLSILFGGPVQ